MDNEYDRKFEDMKKYIPFLESMIKRLESTSPATNNPRQAQLDKIRSLRDLLLNKKKRMKMDNLLKCEQVLINLYAKVEQRDTLPGIKAISDKVIKNEPPPETLPEIARATETEVVCTPGSKEPALFQRRPNKSSPEKLSPNKSISKRNYTRVLVSPERTPRHRSSSNENTLNKPLFTRRSPTHRSPRKQSPNYKKERKKQGSKRKRNDLNITLKVPEESLDSLNTKDILSRIINCNNDDVDIHTLRELRTQILGELKHTGASDDISDLILKSYKNNKMSEKKSEVEEGEISDSESEAIDNIYGSLVIVDKGNKNNTPKPQSKAEKERKIQICLVVKDNEQTEQVTSFKNDIEPSDFEMLNKNESIIKLANESSDTILASTSVQTNEKENSQNPTCSEKSIDSVGKYKNKIIERVQGCEEISSCDEESLDTKTTTDVPFKPNFYKPLAEDDTVSEKVSHVDTIESSQSAITEIISQKINKIDLLDNIKPPITSKSVDDSPKDTSVLEEKDSIEIPLLNEQTVKPPPEENVVSEIDILQALKNEILSETLTLPGSEAATPLLHQPKVTKVASVQEILPKKRISIENYKKKTVQSSPKPLFTKTSGSEDQSKKVSLKLTEKECERFNFLSKLSTDLSSDEDKDDNVITCDDIYKDIAPKSPDCEDFSKDDFFPPVIIPEEPVKQSPVPCNSDVDMRHLSTSSSKQTSNPSAPATDGKDVKIRNPPLDPRVRRDPNQSQKGDNTNVYNSPMTTTPVVNFPDMTPTRNSNMAPNVNTITSINMSNPQLTPNPNMTPNRVPNMTPSRVSNARTYEMTPSHQTFDFDDNRTSKHVYAPFVNVSEPRELREKSIGRETPFPRWSMNEKDTRSDQDGRNYRKEGSETNRNIKWEQNDLRNKLTKMNTTDNNRSRYNDKDDYSQSDRYRSDPRNSSRLEKGDGLLPTPTYPFGRLDCPSTPSHPFGRLECPSTPSHPFGRLDCPSTPSHPFGRQDCPSTPSHPFGRSDCPPTPSHPFGRQDCPSTPSHPFGRSDCPRTPSHPFGRGDAQQTANHSFSRSDCPTTPSHPFGRSDNSTKTNQFNKNDPRVNRNYDSRSNSNYDDDRERYRDRSSSKYNSYKQTDNYSPHDSFNRYKGGVSSESRYNRVHIPEGSIYSKNHYSRRDPGRDRERDQSKYNHKNDSHNFSDFATRRDFREQSIGRSGSQNDHSRGRGSTSIGRNIPHMDYARAVRSTSIGRSQPEVQNYLSIESDAGRPFTIDTSVNSTFQKFLESGRGIQVFEYSDGRRQRAASVGRSMRESSVGRTVSEFDARRKRAGSVGRSLNREAIVEQDWLKEAKTSNRYYERQINDNTHCKPEKSFNEIKADLRSYVSNKETNKIVETNTKEKEKSHSNYVSPRSRKANHEIKQVQSNVSSNYSPRKNSRDPRIRKDIRFDKIKTAGVDKRRDSSGERKNSGIIYSTDNIAKGTILGSGYGVKNYKIPKLKRAEEEKTIVEAPKNDISTSEKPDKKDLKVKLKNENKDIDVKSSNIKNKKKINEKEPENVRSTEQKSKNLEKSNTKEEAKPKSNPKSKAVMQDKSPSVKVRHNSSEDQLVETERRITRSSTHKLSESSSDKEITSRVRKVKTIDDYLSTDESNGETDIVPQDEIPIDDLMPAQNTVKESEGEQNVELNSSFGIDDLDIFSGNMVTDPVIDNINALIADLDKDLGKTDDISGKLLNNIPLSDMIINSEEDDTLNQIQNIISEDLNKNLNSNSKNHAQMLTMENSIVEKPALSISEQSSKDLKLQDNNTNNSLNNEAIVSTSEEGNINSEKSIEHDASLKETDKCDQELSKLNSFPDSTMSSNENGIQDRLPDSTNDTPDVNDVSSTHSYEGTNQDGEQQNKAQKETRPNDKFENLLSILTDKSKIKELLSMLGDQSGENDKIKKKLEKLSEIVSDEEEDTSMENTLECNKNVENEMAEKETVNEKDNDGVMDGKECEGEKEKKENEEKVKDENVKKNAEKVEEEYNVKTSEVCTDSQPSGKGDAMQISLDNNAKEDKNDSDVNDSKLNELTSRVNLTHLPKSDIGKTTKPKKPIKTKGKITKSSTKRLTRSNTANQTVKQTTKKPSRELLKLQEDIKEMFLSEDILNTSGIRMCRLAKFVAEKSSQPKDDIVNENIVQENKSRPPLPDAKPGRKKPGPKPKVDDTDDEKDDDKPKPLKYKPGPKSKKQKPDNDPYNFDFDSVSEPATNYSDDESQNGSDSDNDSIASSKSSGSNTPLTNLKKTVKKRKKPGWQSGVIKSRNKKKKSEANNLEHQPENSASANIVLPVFEKPIAITDKNCFTDKSYCFIKHVHSYLCRLCGYNGNDIVNHIKKQHPHSEIPLSRMSPEIAKAAIEECEDINFRAISKMSTNSYTCRFCFKVFSKKKPLVESFFWHVVSVHTGEYKQLCSECVNVKQCPFNLDIPPPPTNIKGQLIGYICGKCNFTQISLENLKTHVITRHNDEQTEVYTINLAAMTKKMFKMLSKRCYAQEQRLLRSSRSNQSVSDHSDFTDSIDRTSDKLNSSHEWPDKPECSKESDTTAAIIRKAMSKFSFENDDMLNTISNEDEQKNQNFPVKIEPSNQSTESVHHQSDELEVPLNEPAQNIEECNTSNDVLDYPHFKICYTNSGNKEYVCCINKVDNHYKTCLLISMKKHVQMKHNEVWDGYCFVCKVIVTPQGVHKFKDCLQHFLDNHMDNFPVLEINTEVSAKEVPIEPGPRSSTPKNYIQVRPLAELIGQSDDQPKIDSVVSLSTNVEIPQISPNYGILKRNEPIIKELYNYEEAQADIMAKKYRVVLDVMMGLDKLVKIFKCAGRFCSFTSDSLDDALMHASNHERIGGENALKCAYCDYDCGGSSIDLVMHVFKLHGHCQYVCCQCFYRAAASQLVVAHMLRCHGDPNSVPVVRSTFTKPANPGDTAALPREVCVLHYCCNQDGGKCNFRTYTPGKFCEHFMLKHSNDSSYKCNMCAFSAAQPTELVQHLKTHDMRLYQCTWCVFGADTEADLLAHASMKHPSKQPQAYLRIITAKDGTSEFRVLPLAQLNKSSKKVNVIDVAPNTKIEDPVREAERSIELEKLIGINNLTIEPIAPSNPVTKDNVPELDAAVITQEESGINTSFEPDAAPEIPEPEPESQPLVPPVSVTPVPPETDVALPLTPILKTEPQDITPKKVTDVVCLDSEEEESDIIALSDDDTPSKSAQSTPSKDPNDMKKVPEHQAFKCVKCTGICKSAATFKKHLLLCYARSISSFQCAYCAFQTNYMVDLTDHITKNHCVSEVSVCGVCRRNFKSTVAAKRHLKKIHGFDNYEVVSSTVGSNKKITLKPRSTNASGEKERRSYGPQDIGMLPINPIFDDPVYCSLCEFNAKVRVNMVRHLQQHAELQPVANTAPVNPVPLLETNERHFDKMVNLASSSNATRPTEKPRPDTEPAVNNSIPPEIIQRYPKYVPERQRHACGAKGCSYISVDEAMLQYHWETLHEGNNDYHCLHCPEYQHVDKLKPLTARRIITHLKMHHLNLYACSICRFYHYRKDLTDKHVSECHTAGEALTVVIREDPSGATTNTPSQSTSAPTMDLKAWQCGLCKFKSMIRQEVVEHCSKLHQSKMQFKCSHCPFRASTLENVTKHQAKSHADKGKQIFYYYYKEDTIPNEPDGTPRWKVQMQQQKSNSTDSETEIKSEIVDNAPLLTEKLAAAPKAMTVPAAPTINRNLPNVDLNIVKQEVVEEGGDASVNDLCKIFGQFGEPNGLKFKCPLCRVVVEDSKEDMQSHLFEELKYRKWGCAICSYKAFHRAGLKDHMTTEHRQNRDPIILSQNVKIETWVEHLLEYQAALIQKNKENLAKQKIQSERLVQKAPEKTKVPPAQADITNTKEAEEIFGTFGTSVYGQFCCPKCSFRTTEESVFRDHLESELTKIRWCCTACPTKFQTYHEAQYHCKSIHPGQASARPVEAKRDPALRAAWVSGVIKSQKETTASGTSEAEDNLDSSENNLLVVRFEEPVPTPEEQMRRKRPAPKSPDSDEDKLMIDEVESTSKSSDFNCQYCDYSSKYKAPLRDHLLRHYNLKPFNCAYCSFMGHKNAIVNHQEAVHPDKRPNIFKTAVPNTEPTVFNLELARYQRKGKPDVEEKYDDGPKVICLTCEKSIPENEASMKAHVHEGIVEFAKKGDVVIKCCICQELFLNQDSLNQHFAARHKNIEVNFAYSKLHYEKRELLCCGHCNGSFKFLQDLKSHHNAVHRSLQIKFTRSQAGPSVVGLIEQHDSEENTGKRKAEDNSILPGAKRIAKKSTTKLPGNKCVAKKSTTKLPYYNYSDSEEESDEEYSFYGTKPNAMNLDHVYTTMPFVGNSMVRVTVQKFSEIVKLDPKVLIKDIKKN